jgi:hypothetical protein
LYVISLSKNTKRAEKRLKFLVRFLDILAAVKELFRVIQMKILDQILLSECVVASRSNVKDAGFRD